MVSASALLFLLLPVAAVSGWFCGYRSQLSRERKLSMRLPKDYLVGLNYLLNEEPDKAVDVFIRMLTVDSDTVETHLALGSLFRRRGEVDRALRIHQNLIARPNLAQEHRVQALLALGQDYMRAGVLDRAERLFLEVVESQELTAPSLRYLMDIYQQEKSWDHAINTAQKLQLVSNENMSTSLAHFYCELAEAACTARQWDVADKHLHRALTLDKHCARASIIQGNMYESQESYAAALKAYRNVMAQDPDYLSEVIPKMVKCFKALNKEKELSDYLEKLLQTFPRLSIILTLAENKNQEEGREAAIAFLEEQLHAHPSIRGLKRLVEYLLESMETRALPPLRMLNNLMENLISNKPVYRCGHCGFQGKTMHWFCPSCKSWSTVKPIHGIEGDG